MVDPEYDQIAGSASSAVQPVSRNHRLLVGDRFPESFTITPMSALDLNHDEGWADALADVDVLRRVSRPLIHSSNLASEQPESPNAIYWHRCASRSAAS